MQAVEVNLPVWIDGLTRKVLSVTARGRHWFPASQASGRGLVEIAASPRKRPRLEDIPLESVNEVIRAESAGRRGRREVIGITGIGKARRYATRSRRPRLPGRRGGAPHHAGRRRRAQRGTRRSLFPCDGAVGTQAHPRALARRTRDRREYHPRRGARQRRRGRRERAPRRRTHRAAPRGRATALGGRDRHQGRARIAPPAARPISDAPA